MRKIISVCIPCFKGVEPEVLEDYMRFSYHLGRRYPEYDFFLAIKPRSEQFRARNSLVTASLQVNADYILMLDDDHIIDWRQGNEPSEQYNFLKKLIEHIDTTPNAGIVGALYYQRGGECKPVAMNEVHGGYYWMQDHEIQCKLQEVSVTGGGCMLIKREVFDKISSPWFEPELGLGTDIQICKKAAEAGFKIYCDTSIVIGHLRSELEIITPANKGRIYHETAAGQIKKNEGIDKNWQVGSALAMFRMDAEEYLQMGFNAMCDLAGTYQEKQDKFDEWDNPDDYYKNLGKEQIARQVWFHHLEFMQQQAATYFSMINVSQPYYGVDFGCGSGFISYELAQKGQRIDFVDLDGTPAYEFLKWRVAKRNMTNCGFKLAGPYDYIMFFDSIEHFKNWEEILFDVIGRLNNGGYMITNYFLNRDFGNAEHINMNHSAVADFLKSHDLYPVSDMVWQKRVILKAA